MYHLTRSSKRLGVLLLALCIGSLFLTTPGQAADQNHPAAPTETIIDSNITQDTTWTLANSPYRVTLDIYIEPGITLTIEPGVTVYFGENCRIHVGRDGIGGASIVAKGTPSQHITFTRYEDSYRWKNIRHYEGSSSYYRYVDFYWGGETEAILYYNGAGTHVLNHCEVQYSNRQGIVAIGSGLDLRIAGTLIRKNKRWGILTDSGANIHITGSEFYTDDDIAIYHRNRTVPSTITVNDSNFLTYHDNYAIWNEMPSAVINAQNNWWGAADGPNSSSGCKVTAGVDYSNWLGAKVDPLVGITTPPNATFTITPDPTVVQPPGTEYNFDASDCTDVEDYTSSLEVCWDWDNSGNCTEYSTTKTTTHIFAAGAATQTVRLVVRDTDSLTSEATQDVVLNSPPTATFTVNPDTSQREDTVINFDASASSDVEDATASLEVCWDWDNSGDCTDYSTTKTATHSFVYTDGAEQTVRLVVLDTGGLTGEMTKTIHILQNLPPTATFIFTQTTWNHVNFDASASADDYDAQAALLVAWDYEGNGQDTGYSYSVTDVTSNTYPHLGRYWPTLYVKDTTGRVGTLRQPLNIIPPTATTTITGSGGTLDSFDGTVQVAIYTDTVGGEVISNGLVITHTPWLTLPHSGLEGVFTYQGFNLGAHSLLTDSQPINGISGTYTITISYDYDYFADVLHLPFEDKLELYHWSDTEALWTSVTSTLKTADDQLVATTDSFGDFALVMDVCRIYMPLVVREY